jgi:hypothetical protein
MEGVHQGDSSKILKSLWKVDVMQQEKNTRGKTDRVQQQED